MYQNKSRQDLILENEELRMQLQIVKEVASNELGGGQLEQNLDDIFQGLVSLMDAVNVQVYIADLETFEIIYVNKKIRDEFGGDFLGQPCYRVLRGYDSICKDCLNARLLDPLGQPTSGFVWEGQNPMTKSWYINYDRAIRWYDGRLARLKIAVDITQRKQAEQALQENETLLNRSQEVARLGSYSLDIVTGIWTSSPVLNSIFGIDAAYKTDVEGWLQIIHPEDRDFMEDYFTRYILTQREDFDHEYRIIRVNDGGIRWVHGLGKLEFDLLGNPVRMIGTIQDITERRNTEQRLKRHVEEIAAFLSITNQMTSHIELQLLLESIVARAVEVLAGSMGGLYICDAERQEVTCVVSYKTRQDYSGVVLKYGEGAAGKVAATGEPLILQNYQNWEGRAEIFQEEESFNALISAPIIWQKEVKGVLHVLRDVGEPLFAQDDLDLLITLANHAAIAIANARLIQQIQRHTDELESRVQARTSELQSLVNAMTGREIRMAGLKAVIQKLRNQIEDAGMIPIADDPLNEDFTTDFSKD